MEQPILHQILDELKELRSDMFFLKARQTGLQNDVAEVQATQQKLEDEKLQLQNEAVELKTGLQKLEADIVTFQKKKSKKILRACFMSKKMFSK